MDQHTIRELIKIKNNIYYSKHIIKNNAPDISLNKGTIKDLYNAEEENEISINNILIKECMHEFETDIIENPYSGDEKEICYCIYCELDKCIIEKQ